MHRIMIASALVLLTATQVSADPVQWPASAGGNDHYYEYVPFPGILYGNAMGHAMAMDWEGWDGYLASITSGAENDFIVSTFSPPDSTWIGATTDPWQWLPTFEPWDFENWCAGEPDGAYPGGPGHSGMIMNSGCWIDAPSADGTGTGFIVEFGEFTYISNEESTWGAIKAQYR